MEFLAAMVLFFFGINIWVIGRHLYEKYSFDKRFKQLFDSMFTLEVSGTRVAAISGIALYLLIFALYRSPISINPNEHGWGMLQVLVAAGIAAPLFEELVYRGVIFGSIAALLDRSRNRGQLILAAFLIHNYLFMYMHDFQLFDPPRFLAGLLFGLLYIVNDRNLYPGIIAHITYNLSVIIGWFFLWSP